MSTIGNDPGAAGGGEPTEEELRAAYEAEIKKVRVEHVVLEHIVTLVNLGMRRTGLAPGTEDERDLAQVRLAIEAVRALMPVIEQVAPPQAGPIRDALSQLQLAYVRIGGQPAPGSESAGPAPGPPAPGPPAPAPPVPGQPAPDPSEPSAGAPPSAAPPPEPPVSGEPGPAQRSGRLWIPGQ
jgi:hypothetical protein